METQSTQQNGTRALGVEFMREVPQQIASVNENRPEAAGILEARAGHCNLRRPEGRRGLSCPKGPYIRLFN